MRILYAANAGYKYAAQRYYNTDKRIHNGLVRAGHEVWYFSDRDMLQTLAPLKMRHFGLNPVNRYLLKVAKNFRPDAVVLLNADNLFNETLQELRAMLPDMRIAQINVDAIFNPYNRQKFIARRDCLDMQFFTTAGPALADFATAEKPCYFIPNPVDSGIDTGRAFDLAAPASDMACIMTIDPKYTDGQTRQNLALGLAKNLPELRTGYWGFAGHQMLRGVDYIDMLSNSAMALSLSQHISGGIASTSEQRYLYSSDRIAHVTGNGALAFVTDQFALNELYTEREMVFFSDLVDLTEKAQHYKTNPAARQEIARRGWEKAHRDFNGTRVMGYVMDRMFDRPLAYEYAWPTQKILAA